MDSKGREALTHRRREPEIPRTTAVVMFAADSRRNEHYGPYVWVLESELPEAREDAELIAFAAEHYGVSEAEAADLVSPSDIVEYAAAWDDPEFVSAYYEIFWAPGVVGYRTDDGAVVVDLASAQVRKEA